MQDWLARNGQFAPDTSSWRTMTMAGHADRRRSSRRSTRRKGVDVRPRVPHAHDPAPRGRAARWSKDLFATPRAGQEVDVNVFANDVVTVQTAEIGVMRQMLSPAARQVNRARSLAYHPGVVPDALRPHGCSRSSRRSSCRRSLAAQTYPSEQRSAQQPQAGPARRRHRREATCGSSRSRRSRRQFDTARGLTFINSDLAFGGNYVYQGNFAGFTIWDVSNPAKPKIVSVVAVHHVAGRPVDLRQPALHLRRRRRATATTARRAACRTRRTTWPACASTTSPTRARRGS